MFLKRCAFYVLATFVWAQSLDSYINKMKLLKGLVFKEKTVNIGTGKLWS